MKQLSYIFADLSPLKNTRKYAGFCRAIFSTLACCVKTKGQNKDQTKTRKSGPGKPLEAVTRPDLFAKKGRPRGLSHHKGPFAVLRFASIAFVKHVVKHTVYKRSRQGCTPDPHRNQKSGSPLPDQSARVGNTSSRRSPGCFPGPPQGGGLSFPRESPGFYTERPTPVPGALSWASAGWGDTVVTKSFLCARFCALWAAYNANESFFLSAFFGVLGAARGLSRLGVSFPSRAGRGAFPGPPQAFARVYA